MRLSSFSSNEWGSLGHNRRRLTPSIPTRIGEIPKIILINWICMTIFWLGNYFWSEVAMYCYYYWGRLLGSDHHYYIILLWTVTLWVLSLSPIDQIKNFIDHHHHPLDTEQRWWWITTWCGRGVAFYSRFFYPNRIETRKSSSINIKVMWISMDCPCGFCIFIVMPRIWATVMAT